MSRGNMKSLVLPAAAATFVGSQVFVTPTWQVSGPAAHQSLRQQSGTSQSNFVAPGLVAAGVLAACANNARSTRVARKAAQDASPPPFNPADQIGALAPLGFFDPAGFSKTGDKTGFRKLREAELKHARVAMMAALGAVAQHYVKFPGFESVPAGLGAVTAEPGVYGFAALVLASGATELALWTQDPNKEVGDFGDPVGFGQYNTDMRNKELNNGRFAMFAIIGILGAEVATGQDRSQCPTWCCKCILM